MLLLSACPHSHVAPGEPKGSTHEPHTTGDAGQTSSAGPSSDHVPTPDPTAVTAPRPPSKIKIFVRTSPTKMFVHWGKKNLGLTPLTVERPRDSGPVDLVLRGTGFFPMHTRAYTVKNDTISVKMVKLADRMTVFGAKAEVPVTPDPLDPTAVPPVPAPGAPVPSPTPAP
ncbi:MAG: hypothetical protein ABI321_13920 [Polyangia bacterium]